MSAIERLNSLPEVFTGSELTVIFGWKSTIASNYIANWKRSGLIKSLGGRSDIHMNLIKNPSVSKELALRRAYPHAVKIGLDVLRQAGWTTQIPSSIEIAVPKLSTIYEIEGVTISFRPDSWFSVVKSGIIYSDEGIDQLKPAWALVDMIARASDKRVSNAWILDPDDLDIDEVAKSKDIPKALECFGMPKDLLKDDGYETLYSDLFQKKSNASTQRQGR